jgi:hypothetical protein
MSSTNMSYTTYSFKKVSACIHQDIFFSKSFYLLDKSVRDFVVHGTWRKKKLKKKVALNPVNFGYPTGIFGS